MIDAVGAFLHQAYPEEAEPLYVVLPKNVVVALGVDPDSKYKARNYMYELPDADRANYLPTAPILFGRVINGPCQILASSISWKEGVGSSCRALWTTRSRVVLRRVT
jgi:hypothetical protein